MADPTIWFSDKLHDIIDDINGPVAEAMLKMLDGNYLTKNELKIKRVDVSVTDWNFDITIGDSSQVPVKQRMKVGKFIRHFFGSTFTDKQIYDFTMAYNNLKKGIPASTQTAKVSYKKVEVPEFSYNPKDVRSTFLSLTTKTYPHGHEEEVLNFLPSLEKDQFGNYYKIIGKSETMFTSHLDTADRQQKNVTV